jgi:hypothetical protein
MLEVPEPPDPVEQLFVGLVPYVGQQLADFRRDRYQTELHRARLMIDELTSTTQWTPDELLRRVADDDRLADLLLRAIEAARRSGFEHKLRALGRAVASGAIAEDDAEVDTAELLIRTLTDIGVPEIRLLIALADANQVSNTVLGTDIQAALGLSDEVGFALQANLQRHGLVLDAGGGTWDSLQGKFNWRPSPYGFRLLQLLRASGGAQE